MILMRLHAGVWLTAGLWAAALALDLSLLRATLSAPVESVESVESAGPGEPDGEGGEIAGDTFTGNGILADGARLRVTGTMCDVRLKTNGEAPPEGRNGEVAPWPGALLGGNGTSTLPGPAGLAPLRRLEHLVAPGDTLTAIAEGYLGPGAAWSELAAANDIAPPHVLAVGRRLEVPGALVVRTRARLRLIPPAESRREEIARALFAAEANLPPPGAFDPPRRVPFQEEPDATRPERGLVLVHPVWEAYPWEVPLAVLAGFVAITFAAAVWALGRTRGRLDAGSLGSFATPGTLVGGAWRHAASALGWGGAAAAGSGLFAGGIGALAAGAIAGSGVIEAAFVVAAPGFVGLAGYLAAVLGPAGREPSSRALARRFGAGLGVSLAAALALCTAAGWTSSALASLRPPG